MRLTQDMKKILSTLGYSEKEFPQIECALLMSECKLYDASNKGTQVTIIEAKNRLGLSAFMSGIARAAFNKHCMRESDDGSCIIKFDCSKMFDK